MESDARVPKIYTRTGDKGKTSLIGGTRVAKSHLRLDVYGTVDELNSQIGVVLAEAAHELGDSAEWTPVAKALSEIQSDLFDLGSHLACEDAALRAKLPMLSESRIKDLESLMDLYTAGLKPLKNFILPGGSRASAQSHVARTVCRRAERLCVSLGETSEVEDLVIRYLNRLSDYLFVLARHFNALLGIDEPVWTNRR